jgi:hypothetical protein
VTAGACAAEAPEGSGRGRRRSRKQLSRHTVWDGDTVRVPSRDARGNDGAEHELLALLLAAVRASGRRRGHLIAENLLLRASASEITSPLGLPSGGSCSKTPRTLTEPFEPVGGYHERALKPSRKERNTR